MAGNEDPFGDVRGSLSGSLGGGCLAGPALEEHHKATTKMSSDGTGMDFVCNCDNCGQPNKISVSWDELIYGSVGALHKDWKYNPQYRVLYPNVGCRQCNGLLMITFTPDECMRHLKAGSNAGAVSGAYVENGRRQVAGRMQQQMG